jgi:PhnB protein
MHIQPYLFFEGRCEEALEFYRTAIGAETLRLMRYKESPDPSQCNPATLDKVMHGSFRVGETIVLVSDGRCDREKANFDGFCLTLNADSDADAQRLFAALGDGGQVRMPLAETFFASSFGMLADRFGVGWMVIKVKPMP